MNFKDTTNCISSDRMEKNIAPYFMQKEAKGIKQLQSNNFRLMWK